MKSVTIPVQLTSEALWNFDSFRENPTPRQDMSLMDSVHEKMSKYANNLVENSEKTQKGSNNLVNDEISPTRTKSEPLGKQIKLTRKVGDNVVETVTLEFIDHEVNTGATADSSLIQNKIIEKFIESAGVTKYSGPKDEVQLPLNEETTLGADYQAGKS